MGALETSHSAGALAISNAGVIDDLIDEAVTGRFGWEASGLGHDELEGYRARVRSHRTKCRWARLLQFLRRLGKIVVFVRTLYDEASLRNNNNKLVLILPRHTLARAGLANRLLDRLEVVTDNGDVATLRQATP